MRSAPKALLLAGVLLAAALIGGDARRAYAAGATLNLPSAACGSGRADVTFSWSPAGGTEQWLDLSLSDNGFAAGTYLPSGPHPGQAAALTWSLQEGVAHYWRVNTLTAGGWLTSDTGRFVPCGAPQLLYSPVTCRTDATAGIAVLWAPVADPGGRQWVDLSTEPVFVTGISRGFGPLPARDEEYQWDGIRSGLTYYYRVNALGADGIWRASSVGEVTPTCQDSLDNLTARNSPPGLHFNFSPYLSNADEFLIRTMVEASRNYGNATFGLQAPSVTVFAFTDLDQLAYRMARFLELTPDGAAGLRSNWQFIAAAGTYRSMFVNTNSSYWRNPNNPITSPSRLVAHEFFHTLQFEHLGLTPNSNPVWLLEGSAEHFSWGIESQLTGKPKAQVNTEAIILASIVPLPLQLFENLQIGLPGFYELIYLAVDYLVRDRGPTSISQFFRLIGQGTSWQIAFQQSFGLSTDAFYAAFEQYRANGFR